MNGTEKAIKTGDTVKIIAGSGTGIQGIVTGIADGKATVTNLMKGTFIKLLEELKPL